MINLNKKMSLAVKLMTLAVVMNFATGCDSCKDGDKDGSKKADLTVSFDPKSIVDTKVDAELKISNTAKEGEFNPEESGYTVHIVSTIYDDADKKIEDKTALGNIKYEFSGEKGNAAAETKVDLKAFVKEKIAATKDKGFKFEIKGLDTAKHNKAEFKAILKNKDGKEVNNDTLTWKKA